MKLGLILGGIIASLAAIEGALRCYEFVESKGLYRRDNEFKFFEYDPLLGWKNKPGAKGVFSMPDSKTQVSINSKGLRDKEYAYERTKRLRILILGDSFAWGFGLEESERFSEILETEHFRNRIDVINAGVSGYGTDQELLFLTQEGLKYQPDIVILLFGPDDCGDNSADIAYTYPKPRYSLAGDGLALTNVPVPRKELWRERRTSKNPFRRLKLYTFVVDRLGGIAFSRKEGAEDRASQRKMEITKRLLKEVKGLCDSRSITLVVLLKPYYLLQGASPLYKEFKRFLASEGFMVCDPLPDLITESYKGAQFRFKHDVHWNATGNRIVARSLYEYLVSQNLLVSRSSAQNQSERPGME